MSHHSDAVDYGLAVLVGSLCSLLLATPVQILANRLGKPAIPKRIGLVLFPGLLLASILHGKSTHTLPALAKRLGRVGLSLFPLIWLLSFKPSLIYDSSYISLLTWHKWIARTSIALILAHGLVYLVSFSRRRIMSHVFRWPNMAGVIASIALVYILMSSLTPIRRRFYRAFCIPHVPLAILILALMILHARPNAYLVISWCLGACVAQLTYRALTMTHVPHLKLVPVSSKLMLVQIPRSCLPSHFEPGSHLRVAHVDWKLPYTWFLPSHPYTIASLDTDMSSAVLLVRKTRFAWQPHTSLSLSRPFRSPLNYSGQVVLLAAGSGLSFAAPVVRAFRKRSDLKTKLLWVTSSPRDLEILMMLNCHADAVYLTGHIENDHAGLSEPDNGFLESAGFLQSADSAESAEATESSAESNESSRFLQSGIEPLASDANFRDSYELKELSKGSENSRRGSDQTRHTLEFGSTKTDNDIESQTISGSLEYKSSQARTSLEEPLKSASPVNPQSTPLEDHYENVYYGRPDYTAISPYLINTSCIIACGPPGFIQTASSWAKKAKVKLVSETYAL